MSVALNALHTFALRHDEIPAFHAVFLVLTFTAASMINLGAFALLIIGHMALDVVKYHDRHGYNWADTARGVIHESLVDVTIFAVALVFSVYFHHSVGMVTVSGIMRAEMTIVRFIGLSLPKFVILEHMLKVLSHLHHYLEYIHPGMRHGWSRLDRFYIVSLALCVALLFAAAPLMDVEASVVWLVVLHEIIPW